VPLEGEALTLGVALVATFVLALEPGEGLPLMFALMATFVLALIVLEFIVGWPPQLANKPGSITAGIAKSATSNKAGTLATRCPMVVPLGES